MIDRRADALLKAAEKLALERSQGSTVTEETTSRPSNQELTAPYVETAKNNKVRVYGIGSIQFLDANPNEAAAVSLLRNVKTDIQVTKLKDEIAGLKKGLEALLKLNGVDRTTYKPVPHESTSSAPSIHSKSSQQLNNRN